ncbi:MAG: hypothetical protein BroJett031_35720 [Betaproteobacteria bacterium]|nr:MAG: hypothetical protein BroJett031_35720 [Betaproteobacteria bacterium]
MNAPAEVKAAARRFAQSFLAKGFRPAGLHCYTARDGAALYWRMRLKDPESREKIIRPIHLNGGGYVLGEPDFAGKPKPIYRLHEIAAAEPDQPVWWVEGEQKADALARLGLLATTAGGANDDDRRDFEPLRGRHVIVWPDHDDPGRAHGERVAAKLRALGCTIEVLELEPLALPKGGDVVDYLAAHPEATAADLMALARCSVGDATAADASAALPVELLRGDAVTIEPVRWVWDGWLAAGKLHILAGAPGTGKTTIALAFAATITSGGRWPDGTRAEPADVVMWSGEDDPADTLAPRLRAMGTDMSRVHFIGATRTDNGRRAFDPARDLPPLLDALRRRRITPRLLIVDPIVSAVLGDSHKNAEVRQSLAPLVDLAAEIGCAVLGISHFSKGTAGRDPVERVTGSLAFGALARIVLAAAKQPDDQGGGRLLARAKSNIGPDGGGFAYSLEVTAVPDHPTVQATRVLWGDALAGTARELLATAETEPNDDDGADIDGFLRALLADGPMSAKSVLAEVAGAGGYSRDQIQRAARRLGVERRKDGMRGGWVWTLPESPKMAATPPKVAKVAAFCEAPSSPPSLSSVADQPAGEAAGGEEFDA